MPKIDKIVEGETYRIRQWDDMKAEYGITKARNIRCRNIFTVPMKRLCGDTVVAKGVRESSSYDHYIFSYEGYIISPDMLEPVASYKDFKYPKRVPKIHTTKPKEL